MDFKSRKNECRKERINKEQTEIIGLTFFFGNKTMSTDYKKQAVKKMELIAREHDMYYVFSDLVKIWAICLDNAYNSQFNKKRFCELE